MKKVAVLIYNGFCNFEFSVALEILSMAGKPITIFSKTREPIKSEEGLSVNADKTIDELDVNDYDSLLLTGSTDIRDAIEDENILKFIKAFDKSEIIIGAISIAPILLLKAGLLKDKHFMAGINREELLEEGFTIDDMKYMVDWNDNLKNPIEKGYLRDGNIITSVSYNFIKWAVAFGNAIGVEVYPKSFGIESS